MEQLQSQLAEALCEKELARLDLEWEIARRKYLIYPRRNSPGEIPNHKTAMTTIVGCVIIVLGMIAIAIGVSLYLLLMFGPIFMLTVVVCFEGVQQYRKARGYQRAWALHESRRQSIRPESLLAAAINVNASPDAAGDKSAPLDLADQLAEARYQIELARIDKDWEIEKEKHYLTSRHGQRFIPEKQTAYVVAAFGVVFGAIIVISFSQHRVFHLIGAIFALIGIGGGFYFYSHAMDFENARSEYQKRRDQLRPEQFRQ